MIKSLLHLFISQSSQRKTWGGEVEAKGSSSAHDSCLNSVSECCWTVWRWAGAYGWSWRELLINCAGGLGSLPLGRAQQVCKHSAHPASEPTGRVYSACIWHSLVSLGHFKVLTGWQIQRGSWNGDDCLSANDHLICFWVSSFLIILCCLQCYCVVLWPTSSSAYWCNPSWP